MVPVLAEHRDREVGSTNSHSPTVGLNPTPPEAAASRFMPTESNSRPAMARNTTAISPYSILLIVFLLILLSLLFARLQPS